MEWIIYDKLIKYIGYTFVEEKTSFANNTSILYYTTKFIKDGKHHHSQVSMWVDGDGKLTYFQHKDSISILRDPITKKEGTDWRDKLRILCLSHEKELRQFKLESILSE